MPDTAGWLIPLFLLSCTGLRATGAPVDGLLDRLHFGSEADEKAHAVAGDNSEVRPGGLGQPCRIILPTRPAEVSGGSLTFTVRCDPNQPTYLTVRLWGDDVGETVLYLCHDGRQVGCEHSDWPPLDTLNWRLKEPRLPGRFFYSTYLLPPQITRGKAFVTLRIVSTGRVYTYAPSYEKAQYPQEQPSQGIYAVYTHTDPFFTPPADEPQGRPAALGPVWKAPEGGQTPYECARRQAQKAVDGALRRQLLPTRDALGVALAYHAAWAAQHKDRSILDRLIRTVDAYVLKDDVASLGWFGAGELAEAAWRIFDDADRAGLFAQPLGQAGTPRRRAYADFFRKAVDHQTAPRSRGGLTNQDIYILTSVYRCHLLLKRLDAARALPDPTALDLVYQAVGLRPYKGRFEPGGGVQPSTAYRFIIGGPVFLSSEWDHFWVTPEGSSKEHGYVCYYGELAHQTATLYELTGDEQVKRQAVKMIAARAPFRVPANDGEGNLAVRIEAAIGWRHNWYPGRVDYGDPYLKAAALLGDPVSLHLAQLYLQHNMIYRDIDRAELPLLVQRVDNVRLVQAAPPSPFRLPMADGQPDFAWADEGIRAVAFKHRSQRCWMALGWRGAGINDIARVHYAEPAVDRIANIRITSRFTPSGRTITRPAERCGAFVRPGAALVTDGETLPLAAGPLGGMADFHTARYGDYLIAMNCTADRTFTLAIPAEAAGRALKDLVSGKTLAPGASQAVAPATTLVLYLGGQ